MRARIKNIISLAAIGLLVGGATAQCLHATPTRAEKVEVLGEKPGDIPLE